MQVFISINDSSNLDGVRYIDCRHSLTEPLLGFELYSQEHLPGAVHAHLDETLSGRMTGKNGRHPLPKLDDFHEWLQSIGLTPEDNIVLYDNFEGGIAARLWFMLKQIYFENVYILPHSIEEWKGAGFPVESTAPIPSPSSFDIAIQAWDEGVYNIKGLKSIELEIPSNYLIDSRAPERYAGMEEPYDTVAGRIPGAINIYWQSHIDDTKHPHPGFMKTSEIDLSDLSQYTVYCGSGVTAAYNLAVFEQFDLPKPAIYVGSYSEWSQNHPNRVESDS